MDLKVTLIDGPKYPVETIWSIWNASRTNEPIFSPEEVRERMAKDPVFKKQVNELFKSILDSKMPLVENLSFTFILEGMSISLREQMVRHRVGTTVGEKLGVDIIPEAQKSTWWSQTMRVIDVGRFATERRYRMPEGFENRKLKGTRRTAAEILHETLLLVEETYRLLIDNGVPTEQAREVLPMALQHTCSWTVTLASIIHIIGKRSCWIAQSELWFPVMKGMIDELATKVHPYFRNLANPPCIRNGKFGACVHKADAEKRVWGTDPLPPCSLYIANEISKNTMEETMINMEQSRRDHFDKLLKDYQNFWGRHPYTGEPLK